MSASKIEDRGLKIEEAKSKSEDRGSASGACQRPGIASSTGVITDPARHPTGDDPRLTRALEEYLRALEQGLPPNRDEFLARHADLATSLAECLEGLEFVNAVVPQLPPSVGEFGASADDIHPEIPLGDYRITRQVGRGGMGVVYEALQLSLGRRVALKVLPFAAALDAKQLQRFKNEAQAAANLHHTNIVPVYAVGSERGVHYYAMQFIEGQTLASLIRELRQEAGLPDREDRVLERGLRKVESRGEVESPREGEAKREGEAPAEPHGMDSKARQEPRPPEGPALGAGQSTLSAGLPTPPHGPTAGLQDATGSYVPSDEASPEIKDGKGKTREAPSTIENRRASHKTGPITPRSSILHPPSSFFRIVAQLGIQAADALEYAHQMGVIHRDIKPGNLLVEFTPSPLGGEGRGEGAGRPPGPFRLWITDFGLAHCQSQAGLTMTGDLMGTLRYMSPEQALAKRVVVDHRTDIYSLGVTLYELLALEPAYRESDRQELLRQIAFEEPRPLRRLNKRIPAELETIVLKAMEKNPDDRYATAQDLAADLERFLKDEPIRAKRPTVLQRARKWSRRHKSAAVLAVTIAFFLLAILATLFIARRERISELRTAGENAINEAAQSFADGKYDAAIARLTEAQSRLLDAPLELRPLKEQIHELLSKAQEKQRQQKFHQLANTARNCLLYAEDLGKMKACCEQALALYDLLPAGANPLTSFAVEDNRPPAELHGDLFELLLMLADEARRGPKDESKKVTWQQALVMVNLADHLHSGSQAVYEVRADLLKRLGDNAAAQADEERARNSKPQTALDHCWLGRQLWQNVWAGGRAPQQAEDAIVHFKAALQSQPDHVPSIFFMGRAYESLQRYEQAELCYTATIALRPDFARLYYARALLYSTQLNDPGKAAADWTQVIQLAPADRRTIMYAYTMRSEVYGKLGRVQEAIDDLAASYPYRKPDATPGEIVYARGIGHLRFNQFQEALRAFDEAVRLSPEECENEVAWELVDGPKEIRNPQKALPLAEASVRRQPQNHARLNTLGLVFYRLGRWKEAVQTLEAATRAEPHGGEAADFFILAMAHAKLNQPKPAKDYYDKGFAFMKGHEKVWHLMPLNRLRLEAEEAMKMKKD